MTIALIIVGLILLAGSLFADYKWKQWMAARRREHGNLDDRNAR